MAEYYFDIVNKDTPGYLDRINKRELTMLIEMLEDLDHSKTEKTKAAYGYEGPGQWDDAKLAEYKNTILKSRMEEKGYSFFSLRDESGEIVALASGNAGVDRTQLRLLNFTVDRDERGQGHATELLKRISNYAAETGFEKIVMPLSKHAREKGREEMYRHMVRKLGMEFPPELEATNGVRAHPFDKDAIEMVVKPQHFVATERVQTDEDVARVESLQKQGKRALLANTISFLVGGFGLGSIISGHWKKDAGLKKWGMVELGLGAAGVALSWRNARHVDEELKKPENSGVMLEGRIVEPSEEELRQIVSKAALNWENKIVAQQKADTAIGAVNQR